MSSTLRLIPLRAGLSAFVLALGIAVSLALAQEYSGAERLRINDIVRVGQGVLMPLNGALDPTDPADVPLTSDEATAGEGEVDVAIDQPEPEPEPEIDETEPFDVPLDETVATSEPSGEEAETVEAATPDMDAAEAEPDVAANDEIAAEVVDEPEVAAEMPEPAVDEAIDQDELVEDEDVEDPAPVAAADDESVVEEPVDEAATEDLATVEPVGDEPDNGTPAEDEIVAEDLPAAAPVADEPDVEEPAADETVVGDLAAIAPADDQPDADQPDADQPDDMAVAAVSPRSAELGNPESIGPYRLWLASYKTAREAKDGWRILAEANEELLADLTPIIVLKDLGSDEGTFFRLQAGPLQTQASANTRCSALIQRDIYCSVLGP